MTVFLVFIWAFILFVAFKVRKQGMTEVEALAYLKDAENTPEAKDAEELYNLGKYQGDDGKIYTLPKYGGRALVDISNAPTLDWSKQEAISIDWSKYEHEAESIDWSERDKK